MNSIFFQSTQTLNTNPFFCSSSAERRGEHQQGYKHQRQGKAAHPCMCQPRRCPWQQLRPSLHPTKKRRHPIVHKQLSVFVSKCFLSQIHRNVKMCAFAMPTLARTHTSAQKENQDMATSILTQKDNTFHQ